MTFTVFCVVFPLRSGYVFQRLCACMCVSLHCRRHGCDSAIAGKCFERSIVIESRCPIQQSSATVAGVLRVWVGVAAVGLISSCRHVVVEHRGIVECIRCGFPQQAWSPIPQFLMHAIHCIRPLLSSHSLVVHMCISVIFCSCSSVVFFLFFSVVLFICVQGFCLCFVSCIKPVIARGVHWLSCFEQAIWSIAAAPAVAV